MNVIKMFWTMFTSLRHYFKAKDKEAFWDWYWEQIPDSRYPDENLWECWDHFKYYITGRSIIFNVRMWYESRFNHKNFGYSHTFNKTGYCIRNLLLRNTLRHHLVLLCHLFLVYPFISPSDCYYKYLVIFQHLHLAGRLILLVPL